MHLCHPAVVERGPTRAETTAFLARFAAALEAPETAEEAFAEKLAPAGAAFGLDLAALREVAWRRALPFGSDVPLAAVARWRIPPELDRASAAVLDPAHRLRQLRQHVVQAATAVARAKSEAWTAPKGRDLYPVLNQALAEMGLGAGLAEALVALEQRAAAAPAGGDLDVIVSCPIDGEGASLRFSCGRCRWRGHQPQTCYLPAARTFAVAADEMGRGRDMPAGLQKQLGA